MIPINPYPPCTFSDQHTLSKKHKFHTTDERAQKNVGRDKNEKKMNMLVCLCVCVPLTCPKGIDSTVNQQDKYDFKHLNFRITFDTRYSDGSNVH